MTMDWHASTLFYYLACVVGYVMATEEICSGTWHNLTAGDLISLSSPNHPLFYPDNAQCTWRLYSNVQGSYAIHFLQFDTEAEHDWLTVGTDSSGGVSRKNVIYRMSSFVPSHVVAVIEEMEMWMLFEANYGVTNKGFQLEVERINFVVPCTDTNKSCNTGDVCKNNILLCSSYPECLNQTQNCQSCNDIDFMCNSGLGCVDKSLVCDGVRQCLDGSDEWWCYPCGTQVTNMTGLGAIYLTSPNYPLNYPSNSDCIWIFEETTDGTFVINMIDLETEYWDTLMMGHGYEISIDSQDVILSLWYYPKTIVFDKRVIWIRFLSNHAVTFRGFLLEIERIESEVQCQPEEFRCANGYGCLDPSMVCSVYVECADGSDELGCEFCTNQTQILTGNTSLDVSSPFYPLYYPNNIHCIWFIQSESSNGFIHFTFYGVSVHPNVDFFTIGLGDEVTLWSRVLHLTGLSNPRSASANSSLVWIEFTSDYVVYNPFSGFSMQLEWRPEFTPCKDDEFMCASGFGCLDESLVCDSMSQCLRSSDEEGCNLCGIENMQVGPGDHGFNITSPFYPNQFPLTQDCTWRLSTTTPGSIFVIFLDLDTGRYHDELYIGGANATILFDIDDQLESLLLLESLKTSKLLMFTGRQFPKTLVLHQNQLKLAWDASFWTAGGRGFMIHVSWISRNATCEEDEFSCPVGLGGVICLHSHQKCDGRPLCPNNLDEQDCGKCGARNIYLDDSGHITNFTSPEYPLYYPPNIDCKWSIIATDSLRILVRIMNFKLERGFDYLHTGNGDAMDYDDPIAKLTGEIRLRSFASSESRMWMALITDNTGNSPGFYFEIQQVQSSAIIEACEWDELNCGSGFCVTSEGRCDGFSDCVINQNDELHCANIQCPGSYLCDATAGVNISKCVIMHDVCDGKIDCLAGDDETQCDTKRCPNECNCYYGTHGLEVVCEHGWSPHTIDRIARTTNSLTISSAEVKSISPGLFKSLFRLRTLSLAGNGIQQINQDTFDGLHNVTWLDLSHNNVSVIHSNTFEELTLLQELYLLDVPITIVYPDAFSGLSQLVILILVREEKKSPIVIHHRGFRGLDRLQTLYVDDHLLCCHFEGLKECITLQPQPPLFMCGSLMQNSLLRTSMWVLGISALFGNIYVLQVRLREKTKNSVQSKQSFLIGNLAMSDCFMGVYMLILASADIYYGDNYFVHSEVWRSSSLCKVASFLSLLSSEASVFFITLISVDRFLCLVFPFGPIRLERESSKVVAAFLWILAIVLGVIPTLYAGPDSDFYDLSDVCIGLPLITRPSSYSIQSNSIGGDENGRSFDLPVADEFKPAWYFSIAIFLGLNLVCFMVIFVCYIVIFVYIQVSRKRVKRGSRRDEDLKIAIRMAAIVGTDFVCWMPVIIMGILSQTGAAVIPLQMYTWSVVFILPINSSLNPYLYTLASMFSQQRSNKFSGSSKLSGTGSEVDRSFKHTPKENTVV